jgi:hypothetical protein
MNLKDQFELNILLRRCEYLVNMSAAPGYYRNMFEFDSVCFNSSEYSEVSSPESFSNKYHEIIKDNE